VTAIEGSCSRLASACLGRLRGGGTSAPSLDITWLGGRSGGCLATRRGPENEVALRDKESLVTHQPVALHTVTACEPLLMRPQDDQRGRDERRHKPSQSEPHIESGFARPSRRDRCRRRAPLAGASACGTRDACAKVQVLRCRPHVDSRVAGSWATGDTLGPPDPPRSAEIPETYDRVEMARQSGFVSVCLGLSEVGSNFESAGGGSTPPGATECSRRFAWHDSLAVTVKRTVHP
jgi:hypothetical protein